jgi:hypothetical protein
MIYLITIVCSRKFIPCYPQLCCAIVVFHLLLAFTPAMPHHSVITSDCELELDDSDDSGDDLDVAFIFNNEEQLPPEHCQAQAGSLDVS